MSGGPLRTAHRNCSVSGRGATPTERGPLGGVGRSMAQRDYILRLIEQMGQMLIELRNQILGRAASPKDVADGLERVAAQTGIDLALARSATPETLQMLVAPTGDVEPGRCWLVAEMMAVDGLEAEMGGRDVDALAAYERALALFSLIGPGGAFLVGFPEASERVEELEDRMRSLRRGYFGTADPPPPIRPVPPE